MSTKQVALDKLKEKVGTGRISEEDMAKRIDKVNALIAKGVSKTRACYTVGIWVGQYRRFTGPKKTVKVERKAPAAKPKAKRTAKPSKKA